jgi:hypothetical protein
MARIDDCLSSRGEHLTIEGCDAVELVRTLSSPGREDELPVRLAAGADVREGLLTHSENTP